MSQLFSMRALKAMTPPPARGVGVGVGVCVAVGEAVGVALGVIVGVGVSVGVTLGVAVDLGSDGVLVVIPPVGLVVAVGAIAVSEGIGFGPLHDDSARAMHSPMSHNARRDRSPGHPNQVVRVCTWQLDLGEHPLSKLSAIGTSVPSQGLSQIDCQVYPRTTGRATLMRF